MLLSNLLPPAPANAATKVRHHSGSLLIKASGNMLIRESYIDALEWPKYD